MEKNQRYTKNGTKFLSKDEELELGRIIQQHFKAEETLQQEKENLTPEEITELNRQIQAGKDAVENLIKANMGLVYDRARIFQLSYPRGPEFEDLVQEGMTGLMTAAYKYDPERENKFSTVAYYWIAQAVGRGVNKTGRLVRLPENRINENTKITKIMKRPEVEGLPSSEVDEIIMKELGISRSDLRNIRNAAATPASLNKVVASDGGNSKELIDFIAEKNVTVSTENSLIQKEMRDALMKAVAQLSDEKKDVIICSFSLLGEDSPTVEEVRSKYEMAPFRFKRIQAEAMEELKTELTHMGYSFSDFTAA